MKNLGTRYRLMILLLLAAAPALILIFYTSFSERTSAEMRARDEIVHLVKIAAEQQSNIVESARQLLIGFSLVPPGVRDDRGQCSEYASQALKKTSRLYLSMGLSGVNGEIRCSATPTERAVQSAIEQGRFSIGEYQAKPLATPGGITLSYPIADAERGPAGAAFIVLNPEEFDRVTMKLPLPAAAVLTVVDRNGVVLARNPRRVDMIGRKLEASPITERVMTGTRGLFYESAPDGTPHLFAYESVAENGAGSAALRVMVDIPLSVVHAEANAVLKRNLTGAVLATLLLLTAAWFGAELFFLRNVRVLLDTARRVRAGDLAARTRMPYGAEELSQIGRALDEMADALQERQRSIELAMEHLHQQAITDPLTGLHNRRYLYELLPREIMRSKRNDKTMGLIIIDLDHFKRVNDTSGHEAGDLVLREVGGMIMKKVRGSDIVCRYGGEEFCIALPDASLATAVSKAEELRGAFEDLKINYCGKPLRVTASLGVAVYPQHGCDADAIVRAADEALYEAKAAGRNRVVVCNKDVALRQVRAAYAFAEPAPARSSPEAGTSGVSDFRSGGNRRALRQVAGDGKLDRAAAIQVLTGPLVGKEMDLVNNATTVGKKGDEIAVITRTSQGYFVTHIEGPKFPIVNGSTIESRARFLNDRDVIEIAGVKMAFFYKN